MNVWEFARTHLYPYKKKGSEIVPDKCPYCHGGKNKDEETFALNTEKKTFNCKRGSCNKQGTFFQLCKDFGERADDDGFEMYKSTRTYKKPATEIKPRESQAEEYLKLRKISKGTMDLLKVGSDNCGNILFPYYESGELVFVKFRPARKIKEGERKAWRESETKPVLWGMDLCDPTEPLIITEGEIDALSVYEGGFRNAVSVPSGCEDFSWVETCWEWLNQFDKVIIFGDNDPAGREMTKKIIQKLGSHRCAVVDCQRKDANELLYRDGIEAVRQAILNAKDIPVYGLIDLADVEPLDIENMPALKTGFKALDEATGGSILGELSVWTGKRGEGKSTLMSQMMIEAIEQGSKICVYSGELKAESLQYWANLQAAGYKNITKKHDISKGKDIYLVNPDARQKITDWYRGKFFLYDNRITAAKSEEASIFKVFEHAVKKYDCKAFFVDNLMTARYDGGNESDYYLKQINFVRDLVEFAANYSVHVHLVAHPKKTKGALDNDDISGRAEITNLAHNVFSVERNESGSEYDVAVKILKNRWEGARETVGLLYCPASRRLYMPSVGSLRQYGWNKVKEPEPLPVCEQLILPF